MTRKLKRTYFMLLSPAFIGLIVVGLANEYNFFAIGEIQISQVIAPVIFILSVIFAVALPVFLRSLFAHKIRNQKSISESDLIKFERSLIYAVSIVPYLGLTACLFELPLFYITGTVLMSLYAVYYYYPSKKRIQFERRIFRVR